MPTYEYACKSCGRHLEVVQSFKDDPLTECPHCGGQLRKVFGSVGIAFKGSGFYKTDSRGSGTKRGGASSGDGGSSSSEKRSDSSEKKSDSSDSSKSTSSTPASSPSSTPPASSSAAS
jgi:putative FmdB family regulatory protein